MTVPSARSTHGSVGVAELVSAALLAHDLPDATSQERDAAGRYVRDALDAMPDLTRFGVRAAGAAAYLVLSALGRAPYRILAPGRRSELAARLFERPLPVLAEFGTLTRGLGLVGAHEVRYPGPEVSSER